MQIGVETSRAVESRRIFVLHSDEILRAALQFMLHDEYEAHEIPDADGAFRRAAGRAVDLVLVDLGTLWKEGTGLIARLKEGLGEPSIVLVAESEEDPDAHACLDAGADAVLGAPLRIDRVRSRVERALAERLRLAA